jgi:hypothetical protein
MERDIVKRIEDLMDLFDEGEVTTADQTQRPEDPYRDFNERNPLAGGGMLVQPSADGSRPGYANRKPKFASKEFIAQRDKGKDIPKVREYLNKVLLKKDSIVFKNIEDIKNKAGLRKDSKVNADISRLLNTEYKDKVQTEGQIEKKKFGNNAEKFRKILRDIQKTIPKGKKQFINIAYTAKKNKLEGNPSSASYSRVLQEPEFDNFVVLTKDVQSNPQIIRFAEEFEKLYEIQDIDKDFFGQLAKNIYGKKNKDTLRKISADASKYAEFLYGVRDVKDADGKRLKLPSVEKRGDYLFELLDETLGLEEGEKGKVRPFKFGAGYERDRMFAIRDGLLGLKEGQTEAQRINIRKLLKKGYNLDEVAGLSATHEIAPGYTELVQGLRKKVNSDKAGKIDKPFARILEQVITGEKPAKGYKYGTNKSGRPIFYQDINEVVNLYNKDAAAYGKKYGIDVPLIEYDKSKKLKPQDFLKNYKYLSPEAKANVQDLARKGVGIRTEAITMSQFEDAGNPNLKTDKIILNKIQSYSKLPKCKVNLKADGGRIGFANSIECIQDGLKEQKIAAQQGNKKAAQELIQVGKVATRAGLLKNVLGPGALLGEAVYEGAVIGNKVLGGTPADIAWAESYISYLDPKKYRGELDPLKMRREDMLTREVEDADGNIKTIDAPGSSVLRSGFAAQDQLSAFNKAIEDRNIAKKARRIDQYLPAAAEAREQGRFADQSADIISSDAFKDASRIAQEYLQGQTGANIAKYRTEDFGRFESGKEKADRKRRMQKMFPEMPRQFLTEKTSDLLNRTRYLRSLGFDVSTRDLMAQQEALRSIPLSQDAITYGPEQVYGARGAFFSKGGIAGLSGGDKSGPPPERGPNPQGLLSLKNRVRNR